MQDPLNLLSSRLGLDEQYRFLTAGQRYRVIQPFVDFDNIAHLPGEQWLFVGTSFLPHDDGRSLFVSLNGVDGLQIRFQDAPEEQGEILSHLETYLAHVIVRVTSDTDLAPVASETSLAPVTKTAERILELVKAAFGDVRGIDGEAPNKATPGDPPPDLPETNFVPEITPPLPLPWPAERFVYYAYARQILGGDAAHDSEPWARPENVSEPWARIESGSELVLEPLSGQLKLLGRQDVKPAPVRQRRVFDEGARAAPLEDLLLAAGKSAAVAQLVRKSYCKWQSHNLIASAVLQRHPEFARFLDCANAVKEPLARPQPSALIQPEFNRRWLLPKDRPNDWELCTSNGFPAEWPVGAKTKIAYYAAAIRCDKTSPEPRPWEVTEPWGVVVRDGYYGALAFTSLTSNPNSLGIEPGKARTGSFVALLKKISDLMQDRQHGAIDELFAAAAQDPQMAALVRSWYKQWIEDNSLLAAWALPRHAAFAAFINGAAPPAKNADAQNNLGLKYANGRGVAKDEKTAVVWYAKAAEQGNADAQNNLGRMYAAGRGVAKDEKTAVLWYTKAAEQGYAVAQFNLGAMYANGRAVAKDEKTAAAWYTKAAEQGDADAQNNLGRMYAAGQGVAKDEITAVAWYCKAAGQGNALAQYNLGAMLANGRGVAKDELAAVAWYTKAAEQGYAYAQVNLGWIYANGRGVTKDENAAALWYAKAAEQGNADAQYGLGRMYAYGQSVAKDENTAVLWYAKAAEQGNALAQFSLGVRFVDGRGVDKDEKTAVLWYAKAAKQGFADAQFNLGAMYADGRGVTQDIVSAHMWFYLAARAGDGAAVKRRDLAAAQMTPIQLSRAQDRAQRCINSNYKDCD